jgi:glucose-1-phosphate cytidylyltransferase
MKVLILAGGLGTRLSEETQVIPKPMVEIGDRPILWHIMKMYSHHGFTEFVLLLGYRGSRIRNYFVNYLVQSSDVTLDLRENSVEIHENRSEPWKVTLLDTGLEAMTGARIRRARSFVGDQRFMLTYGDGVSDVNLRDVLDFHLRHGRAATMTVIQPEGRFGSISMRPDGLIGHFQEKPAGEGGWVNGGFFVCEPEVFDYIDDEESTIFERSPLERLAGDERLVAYRHAGFWRCMDTLHDKAALNELWNAGCAPWRTWGGTP